MPDDQRGAWSFVIGHWSFLGALSPAYSGGGRFLDLARLGPPRGPVFLGVRVRGDPRRAAGVFAAMPGAVAVPDRIGRGVRVPAARADHAAVPARPADARRRRVGRDPDLPRRAELRRGQS